MTRSPSGSDDQDCASMLTRYAQLAVELEDELDQARSTVLRRRLAELDDAVDVAALRTAGSRSRHTG